MKKSKRFILATVLVLAMVMTMCTFLAACGPEETPPEPSEATVESIALDTSGAQLVFAYGETFTAEGLKVTATMSDKTTKSVALSDCRVSTPSTTNPGKRSVNVSYEGKSARYEITVQEKVIPPISATSLFSIEGTTPNDSYRVEAEAIDYEISGVVTSGSGKALLVDDESVSGGKYLANYGVSSNYFGFTFTAEREYTDAVLVFRMANPTASSLAVGNAISAHLNYAGVSEPGSVDISAMTALPAAGEDGPVWEDRVLRGVTIPAGTNKLTFEVLGETVPYIDYVELYVGKKYVNSRVDISEVATYTKEFEDFDLEKIVVRPDIKNAYQLKDGEAFIETPSNNLENTSGGKSVGAFVEPTEISTTISTGKNATVEVIFVGASVKDCRVKNIAEFYIDGVKLDNVQDLNIKDGDPQKGEYWRWKDTSLGYLDLAAGDHPFTMKVIANGELNADCFKFVVKSYGEFSEHPDVSDPDPVPTADVVITENTTYTQEAEDCDLSECVLQAGWDHIAVETPETTEPATSGGKSLGAIGENSRITVSVELKNSAAVQVLVRMAKAAGGNASSFAGVTVNGRAMTSASVLPGEVAGNQYYNWSDADYGSVTLAAGTYDFVFTLTGSPNLDCFKFAVSEYGTAALSDVTVTAAQTYTVEAESLDKTNWILQDKKTTFIEETSLASGGACVAAIASGSVITVKADFKDAAVVKISALMAKYEADYSLVGNVTIKLDDADVTVPSTLLGRAEDGSNDWYNFKDLDFGTHNVTAGVHTLTITVTGSCANIDCFKFAVTSYGAAA